MKKVIVTVSVVSYDTETCKLDSKSIMSKDISISKIRSEEDFNDHQALHRELVSECSETLSDLIFSS